MTSEQALERDCVALLHQTGWKVYRFSQGYRPAKGGTRQTPGIPDLYAIHRGKRLTLWVEVKPADKMREAERLLLRHNIPAYLDKDYRRAVAQQIFGEQMHAIGQPYCYGGLPELMAELARLGFGFPQSRQTSPQKARVS